MLDDEKSHQRDEKSHQRWIAFAVVVLGFGILVASVAVVAVPDAAVVVGWVVQVGILVGLVTLGVGVGLLGWWSGLSVWRLKWIELCLLVLGSSLVASLILLFVTLPGAWAPGGEVMVPIPVGKLVGGAEPLTLGRKAVIVAVVPNAQETPVASATAEVKAVKLLGESGDKGTLLVEVPAAQASGLQEALLNSEASFTYRLLPDRPEVAPEPTYTPKPGSTAALLDGSMAFDLPVFKIQSDWQSLAVSDTLLVILVEEQQDAEGQTLGHNGQLFTNARVLAVLDGKSVPIATPTPEMDSKGKPKPTSTRYPDAEHVRIGLPRGTEEADAIRFAGALEGTSGIHLLVLTPTPPPRSQ